MPIKLIKTRGAGRLCLFLALFFTSSACFAESLHGPHQHGTVEIAQEKSDELLILNMLIPAEDLFGFEHNPVTNEQIDKIKQADQKLYEESSIRNLFVFQPFGSCVPFQTDIVSDILDFVQDQESSKHTDKPAITHKGKVDSPESKPPHSDVFISYQFDCSKVDKVSLGFSDEFPTIKQYRLREESVEGKVIKTMTAEDAVLTLDWSPKTVETLTDSSTGTSTVESTKPSAQSSTQPSTQ